MPDIDITYGRNSRIELSFETVEYDEEYDTYVFRNKSGVKEMSFLPTRTGGYWGVLTDLMGEGALYWHQIPIVASKRLERKIEKYVE